MNKQDLEFLIDLQHELNTQENDGNADPLYWGIIEDVTRPAYDGCGDGFFAVYDGESYYDYNIDTLKEILSDEAVEFNDEELSDEELEERLAEKLAEINAAVTLHGLKELFDDEIELYDYESTYEVITGTGAFLTKREAKRYAETYYYNHKNARTYALTAYRNFELERLLKILKETNWETMEVTE